MIVSISTCVHAFDSDCSQSQLTRDFIEYIRQNTDLWSLLMMFGVCACVSVSSFGLSFRTWLRIVDRNTDDTFQAVKYLFLVDLSSIHINRDSPRCLLFCSPFPKCVVPFENRLQISSINWCSFLLCLTWNGWMCSWILGWYLDVWLTHFRALTKNEWMKSEC